MKGRLLLATDLDGTLLGDQPALEGFSAWLQEHRASVTLVYATGRTVVDVQRLVQIGGLPAPDHIIGSVGSEVAPFETCRPAGEWTARVGNDWNRELICAALANIPRLELQPDEFQSELKVSYFLESATADQVSGVTAQLSARQLEVEVIYSGSRFIDILPRGINKGAAVEYLARHLQFQRDEVIACGDSGNDLSMCERGFRAVLVANADADLLQHARQPRYHSPFSHAAGVLDGVQFWMAQEGRRATCR